MCAGWAQTRHTPHASRDDAVCQIHLLQQLGAAARPWPFPCSAARHSPMALAFETPNSVRRKPALVTIPRKSTPSPHGRPALGAILVERLLITEEQLKAAIEQQKRTDRRLGQVLIDMGATTQDAVLGALSIQLGLPGIRINAYTIDAEAIDALPEKVARRHGAFPISKVGTTLTVAVAVPQDLEATDDLRFASGCEIRTVVALDLL